MSPESPKPLRRGAIHRALVNVTALLNVTSTGAMNRAPTML